jgi:dTDP-glucose pyrophosphorylase
VAFDRRKKIIIPAAGYGVRMGRPAAKELLPHPRTGRPLMHEVLESLAHQELPAVVLVRHDKPELIDFVESWQHSHPDQPVELLKVNPTVEWPQTVLLSAPAWTELNALYLPDTEFEPADMLKTLFAQLASADCAFAGHRVEDPSHWGLVQFAVDSFKIADKPKDVENCNWAWGLIAFRQKAGERLFGAILTANQTEEWQDVALKGARLELTDFKDLTRPGRTSGSRYGKGL